MDESHTNNKVELHCCNHYYYYVNDLKSAVGQKETLVYADIGPMSLKQRVHVPHLQLDDNRVEYAQLTVHADKDIKLQETQLEVYFKGIQLSM